MYRIFIVDDHPAINDAYTMLVNRQRDMYISEIATSGQQALQMLEGGIQIDLALVDISLNDMNGLILTESIHKQWPELPILVMSAYGESGYATAALRVGAKGYIDKYDSKQLIAAIQHVLKGKAYISELNGTSNSTC